MSNFRYLRDQTRGIVNHNYSTFALRHQALVEQYGRIKRNLESGDLTDKQAKQLFLILGNSNKTATV